MLRNVTLEKETLNAFLVPPQPFIVVVDLNHMNAHKAYYDCYFSLSNQTGILCQPVGSEAVC